MPACDANTKTGRQYHEHAVDPGSELPRIVQRRDQENHAKGDRRDALENAEGTRIEEQNMLGIKGKAHHARTCEKACKIQQALTW